MIRHEVEQRRGHAACACMATAAQSGRAGSATLLRAVLRLAAASGLALLLTPLPTWAQTPRVGLSLREAVDRAIDTSARLRDMRARGVAAEASVKGAQAADEPQLTLLGGFTRTNHVDVFGVPQPDGRLRIIFPDLPSNYQARIDGQWPVYTSGRVAALERSATADLTATRFDERTLRADVVFEVTRTYWSVVAGTFAADAITASVARLDAHLSDVRARFAAGFAPPNDVTSVEAQRALEQATLIETQLQVDQQLMLLKHLVGLPLDTQVRLTEPVAGGSAAGLALSSAGSPVSPALVPAAGVNAAAPLTIDVSGRPELLGLEARAAAAGARAAAAAAERGPTVAIAAGVDLARPNARRFPREDIWQHSWDVGVQVSWSLFDAGRVEARRAAAAASETALREQHSELAGRFAVEVAQRRLEVVATAARLRATEAGVAAARENLRVVQARFAAGVAANTDVIDGETALLRAELDRTHAQISTHLATAQLERALVN